jgi:hypothetical protein
MAYVQTPVFSNLFKHVAGSKDIGNGYSTHRVEKDGLGMLTGYLRS